jgi:hypothetical protein
MITCNIETILKEDPNIVAIHRPRILNVPLVHPDLWSKDYRAHQQDVVRYCQEYLGMPIIEDRFTDNVKRKEWVYQMREQYPDFEEFWNNNALRYTHLIGIAMNLSGFHRGYIGTNKPRFEELKKEVATSVPSIKAYDKIPTPIKIAFVQDYKVQLKSMLRFLSKQKPIIPALASVKLAL